MLINPTSRSRGKKAASWLITLSMLLSLFPVIPAKAAGLWAATYDADALTGENLIIEIYDADSGFAELIEWTDVDVMGERIADKTADEIFGDGNSHYAVVQYQNFDAVMAEYRNYLIITADLESVWAELPDTSEDPMMESKATYDGDFDAYVDAYVEQQTGNMTPVELQNYLDEMFNYGAKEVHMRIACPPLIYSCPFIGFSSSKGDLELMSRRIIKDLEGDENKNLDKYATTGSPQYERMVEEIRKRFGLTSLKFNTLEILVEAIGLPKCKICTHCFDGSSHF